jgi:hypothetical protein
LKNELWDKYQLLTVMMKLRKARFNASERLATRYRWQSISLVVFSIYVIALSIIPQYVRGLSDGAVSAIGLASVVSSVFVVALSVYSAFSEDVVRGKYLHDNAKQVTRLYNEYKVKIDDFENRKGESPDHANFESRYSDIMDSCPYNHDQIDYQAIRAQIEKLSGWENFSIKARTSVSTYFWPCAAIAGPPLLVAIGIWSLGPDLVAHPAVVP